MVCLSNVMVGLKLSRVWWGQGPGKVDNRLHQIHDVVFVEDHS